MNDIQTLEFAYLYFKKGRHCVVVRPNLGIEIETP